VNELKDKAGAALMKVHRSYLAVIKKLSAADLVVGLAHITGGGITENLPRIFPNDRPPWSKQPPGRLPPSLPIYNNCGSVEQRGDASHLQLWASAFLAVVPADKFRRTKSMLDRAGENSTS